MHDQAGFIPHHNRRGEIACHIMRAHADVHDIQLVEAFLPEWFFVRQAIGHHTGVVDQNIQPALLLVNLLKQGFYLFIPAVVHSHRHGCGAALFDFLGCLVDGARQGGITFLHAAAGDVNYAARFGQRQSYALSGTAAGASYHYHAFVVIHVCAPCLCPVKTGPTCSAFKPGLHFQSRVRNRYAFRCVALPALSAFAVRQSAVSGLLSACHGSAGSRCRADTIRIACLPR